MISLFLAAVCRFLNSILLISNSKLLYICGLPTFLNNSDTWVNILFSQNNFDTHSLIWAHRTLWAPNEYSKYLFTDWCLGNKKRKKIIHIVSVMVLADLTKKTKTTTKILNQQCTFEKALACPCCLNKRQFTYGIKQSKDSSMIAPPHDEFNICIVLYFHDQATRFFFLF